MNTLYVLLFVLRFAWGEDAPAKNYYISIPCIGIPNRTIAFQGADVTSFVGIDGESGNLSEVVGRMFSHRTR